MLGAKVERDKSGFLVIDGVSEHLLVRQHDPKIKVVRAPGKPRHLSHKQIAGIVKLMKVKAGGLRHGE